MTDIIEAIDKMIVDCSKRDLVPSGEIVDSLLDLRALVATEHLSVTEEELLV